MKLFKASAILLIAPASAFPAFLRSHRALLSEQCVDETDGYVEDSLMVAAYDAVEDEIDSSATCSDIVLDKSSCQVDFASFDSAEEFVEVCSSLGGKTIKLDATINCNYATTQIARSDTFKGFNFEYNNLMDCVSMQCEDESVKGKIGDAIDSAASDVAKVTGATCTYTVGDFAFYAAGDDGLTDIFVEDVSSAQCHSLMTAAIGLPLLALAV